MGDGGSSLGERGDGGGSVGGGGGNGSGGGGGGDCGGLGTVGGVGGGEGGEKVIVSASIVLRSAKVSKSTKTSPCVTSSSCRSSVMFAVEFPPYSLTISVRVMERPTSAHKSSSKSKRPISSARLDMTSAATSWEALNSCMLATSSATVSSAFSSRELNVSPPLARLLTASYSLRYLATAIWHNASVVAFASASITS